jgi:probable rRNA maturation factor
VDSVNIRIYNIDKYRNYLQRDISQYIDLLEDYTELFSLGLYNVVFVESEVIKKLNRKYRDKKNSTDVLTFPIKQENVIGEIYISMSDIEENLQDTSHDLLFEETLRMVIHGMLHLQGYEHESYLEWDSNNSSEEKIFKLQEKILKELMQSAA